MTIYLFTSVWIGLMTYHARDGDQLFTRHLHTCRYISEMLMGLGMVGTLIGYLLMVKAMAAGAINVADATAAQATILKLANGLGTSSIVTLVGLVGAIGIKAQITNIEYLLEENDAS
jgi:beta-lactamase regulating signal transducer with metallopeptidase domain